MIRRTSEAGGGVAIRSGARGETIDERLGGGRFDEAGVRAGLGANAPSRGANGAPPVALTES